MFKKLCIFVLLYCSPFCFSQTENKIEEKVISFFEALNKKNSEDLALHFAPNAQLQSILLKDHTASLRLETVADFIEAIQNIPNNVTVEEKINPIYVKTDGALAFAAMDYEFYVNQKLSHRGTNYFQLVLMDNEWLIVHILDSRIYD